MAKKLEDTEALYEEKSETYLEILEKQERIES